MEENPYRSPVDFDAPKSNRSPPANEQYHVVFIVFGALNCIVLLMMFPPATWNLMTIVHPPWPLFGTLGFFLMAWGSKTNKMWLFYVGLAALAVAGALIMTA
jgi:hypothetical protein